MKASPSRRLDPPGQYCPQAYRTSIAVDWLLNYQDWLLYAMRYCHATTTSARLAVRAIGTALLLGDSQVHGVTEHTDMPEVYLAGALACE
jgi:hypothetical protein